MRLLGRRLLLSSALVASAMPLAAQGRAPKRPAAARPAAPAPAPAIPAIPEIAYTKFVLANGLTLLVHEDHKAPIAAVNVWYHVGSKNEKAGRTGFAHLFEHLMFNGSENYDDDYFKAVEKVGATDLNGTTNVDRTNYFQNVPTSALDLVLFLESDRMGHLLGAVSQARLDEQRGVVQNEKRQGENQPYGVTRQILSEQTYPAGHPYSWTTIGSMEDLSAAKLDDVKEWFRTYYGPNNAVLVVAGDVNPQEVKAKVEKYFGDIRPGPPVAKQEKWIAKMTGTRRSTVQDRVPQGRVYKVWNVPEWGSAEADHLSLYASVLGGGKSSRLYKRLVYEDQSATSAAAYVWEKELGSQFYIDVTVRPGGDLRAVERAIDEEMAQLLREGPTVEELTRVKQQMRAQYVRGIERIGGFGGKSDILATNQVYGGDASAYRARYARAFAATPSDVRRVANEWLADGVFVLEVAPYPSMNAVASSLDRSKLPAVGTPAKPSFPTLETASLGNGMKVVLARRDAVPTVNMQLIVDAGYASDRSSQPGVASVAMNLLDEGTTTRNALQIAEELERLGASLSTGSDLDASTVTVSTLKEGIDPVLGLMADIVLNPAFSDIELERLKKRQIAQIQREKNSPQTMAMRVLPVLLYGEGHPYATPLTGSGTEASVAGMDREQMVAFHRTWFKPNNATIVVVGAISMPELLPKLERLFGAWQPGQVPAKQIGDVAPQSAASVYLIDRPGALQSVIMAGTVAPPKNNADEVAITAFNDLLGGSFTSRVNMNLREDKHWSYGAFTFLPDARGQRPFIVLAPVQTDRTKESVAEVVRELRGVVGDRPITSEELEKAKQSLTSSLPGQWETNAAVLRSMAEIVRYGLPQDWFANYAGKVGDLRTSDMPVAGFNLVRPDKMLWVVVGDRAKIETGIRELNLGPVRVIDTDGKPLATP